MDLELTILFQFLVLTKKDILMQYRLQANQSWKKWREKKTSITDAVIHVEVFYHLILIQPAREARGPEGPVR